MLFRLDTAALGVFEITIQLKIFSPTGFGEFKQAKSSLHDVEMIQRINFLRLL